MVEYIIVGTHQQIVIPPLDGYRSAPAHLRGLRLIHTHLNGEKLSDEDLTDLALLRLDLICAVEVTPDGSPGVVHIAHLIPENPEKKYWTFLKPVHPGELNLNFLAFINALEDEFAETKKSRPVEAEQRAFLIRVETKSREKGEKSLEELKELARSCGINVFDTAMQMREAIDSRYVMGKGKLSDVVIRALQMGANLLIFDHELTPSQVRSISDFTEMRVMDRTQVILEIFAQRAHSREGKIQVELAQLKYLLPRLVGRYSTLSRLTGGIGSRGPGETKLEIMRRRIKDRIHLLERELKEIQKDRNVRRVRRSRLNLPIISIVGYTNAGKSTLLNALTRSSVLTEDKLFATLDPKSSKLRFPQEAEAIITDTVGFIKDLPKDLFAAFRATLDELQEAHLLLHVIDVSNPDFKMHIEAVEKILEELNLSSKPVLRVFNKMDLFTDHELLSRYCRTFDAIAISALQPETLLPLVERVELLLLS